MRSLTNPHLLSLSFILFLCLSSGSSTYSKYYIEDYCGKSALISAPLDSSLLVYSSRKGHQLSDAKCSLDIAIPPQVDGLIVTVESISLNDSSKQCIDYLQFGSSSVEKWCNSSQNHTLLFPHSNCSITFNTGPNSDANFELVITPYLKSTLDEKCNSSSLFRCEGESEYQCISKNFTCDGIKNCPTGYDEKQCLPPNLILAKAEHIDTNQTLNDESKVKDSLNTEFPETTINADLDYEDVTYATYYISDYCNSTEQLFIDDTQNPVILKSSRDNETLLNTTCVIHFDIPHAGMFNPNKRGLILSIDDIAFSKNSDNNCSNYILIESPNSLHKWCNASDAVGKAFEGKGTLDITFRVGNESNSNFTLVITPFSVYLKAYCPSGNNMRCHGDGTNECIPKSLRCDGHNNCPTNIDEQDCPAPISSSTPPSTATPNVTTTTTQSTTTKTTTTTQKTTTTSQTTTTAKPTITTSHSTKPTITPTATPITTSTPKPDTHKLSPGMIALIVISSVVVIGVIVVVVLYIRRRRRNGGYVPLNE